MSMPSLPSLHQQSCPSSRLARHWRASARDGTVQNTTSGTSGYKRRESSSVIVTCIVHAAILFSQSSARGSNKLTYTGRRTFDLGLRTNPKLLGPIWESQTPRLHVSGKVYLDQQGRHRVWKGEAEILHFRVSVVAESPQMR